MSIREGAQTAKSNSPNSPSPIVKVKLKSKAEPSLLRASKEFFSGLLIYLKEEPNAKAGERVVLLTSINLCLPASSLMAVASAKAPAKKSDGNTVDGVEPVAEFKDSAA